MDKHLNQLVEYIKQHLASGTSEENIRKTLIEHSWDPAHIDRAFILVKTPPVQQERSQQPIVPAVTNTQKQTEINKTNVPEKYRVSQAIYDTIKAIRYNSVTYLFAVIVSYVFSVITLGAGLLIFAGIFFGGIGLSFTSVAKLLVILFAGLILYTLWYALTYAFVIISTSLALYAGSERRKSSFKDTASKTFSSLVRVSLANALFSVVVVLPAVLIISLPMIFLAGGVGGFRSATIIMPFAMLAVIIWEVLAVLRYALVPYVALFEPDVPIRKTLVRSKHLLQKGGQWFLVKGFLLVVLVYAILGALTGSNSNELGNSNNPIMIITSIVATVLVGGALLMLYKNRKAVRG